MIDVIRELESKRDDLPKLEITRLHHAYRINGIVDLYKSGSTVYFIQENRYENYGLDKPESKRLKKEVFEYLKITSPREPFKKTAKGRMTYQEFKNQLYNENKIKYGNTSK